MRSIVYAVAVALAATITCPSGSDAQSAVGVIEGTVTLQPPPPPRRTAQRYPAQAGQAETHEVQQLPAVVYLVGPSPGGQPSGTGTPAMTQSDTTFIPPVVHVQVGGSVEFPNGDSFFHNVFSFSTAQRFDLGRYPQGESKEVTFGEAGIVEVFCEVHEFMRGAIIVTESPYFAVVGDDGAFRIEGVPEGQHTIAFWQQDHERLEQSVTVTSGGTARVEVELRR